ncbi:hypothetical protein DL98DRAFT_540729 [Cadophora sp. DSE1049]|nr:hypothetical protein DL98DRAFT_540729 [Cadophora sp. DSE1049]
MPGQSTFGRSLLSSDASKTSTVIQLTPNHPFTMLPPNNLVPLNLELEMLVRGIQAEQTCVAKSSILPKCSNKINKKHRERLVRLLEAVISALQSGTSVNEELLREASSLVMCTRHQGLANSKFEEWCGRIGTISPGDEPHPDILEMPSLTSIDELLGDFNSLEIASDGNGMGGTNPTDIAPSESYLKSNSSQAPSEDDFEDSSLGLGDEDGPVGDLPQAPEDCDSLMPMSATPGTGPGTPKRSIMPAMIDSAISMSNDKTTTRYLDGSESPTAAKAKRSNRVLLGERAASAPTPERATSIESRFIPFNDPLKNFVKYIKTPLTPTHTLEGYIYCFEIEGTTMNKIGSALPRSMSVEETKVPITLEESLVKRMSEHKGTWGSAPKVLLKLKVPYARRIEKIIHYHLEHGRMKELANQIQSEKEKKIPVHNEWFNNSFAEISIVMKAWRHWSLMMPYVKAKQDGKPAHSLSPHWEACLKTLKPQPFRDHWMDWLYEHVPELGKQMPLSAKERIEKERSVQRPGTIVRSNAAGTKWVLQRSGTS